jgi:hypothetical protein
LFSNDVTKSCLRKRVADSIYVIGSLFAELQGMHTTIKLSERAAESPDYAALLLMLSYVEAECLRIGAADAARHAAMAAAMMPAVDGPPVAPAHRPYSRHLH